MGGGGVYNVSLEGSQDRQTVPSGCFHFWSGSGKPNQRKWDSRTFGEGVRNWFQNPLLLANVIQNPLKRGFRNSFRTPSQKVANLTFFGLVCRSHSWSLLMIWGFEGQRFQTPLQSSVSTTNTAHMFRNLTKCAWRPPPHREHLLSRTDSWVRNTPDPYPEAPAILFLRSDHIFRSDLIFALPCKRENKIGSYF